MFEYYGHIHVYSPGAGADNPLGEISFHQHKCSVHLPISCKFCPSNHILSIFPHSNDGRPMLTLLSYCVHPLISITALYPHFPLFCGYNVVSTYAVIPAVILYSLSISVELPLLGNYARNGPIDCNLIPRIPGILQYKPNPKINFCSFFIKIQFNQNN